jgi:1,4-dihydroxy-2-naphthoyl-CoA hydrolase
MSARELLDDHGSPEHLAQLRTAAAILHDPRPETHPFADTVFRSLGIELVAAERDQVAVRMRIAPAVRQPAGLLHGGVSALLIESAASIGAGLSCAPHQRAFGVEVHASHLRSATDGIVICIATPLRKGRTMQVWNGQLYDGDDRLLCDGRCTLMISDVVA